MYLSFSSTKKKKKINRDYICISVPFLEKNQVSKLELSSYYHPGTGWDEDVKTEEF